MDFDLLQSTVVSSSILINACIVLGLFYDKYAKRTAYIKYVSGLCSAGLGLIILTISYAYDPLLLIDSKTTLVCATAMFFGSVPSAISTVILSLALILIGGPATLTNLLTMGLSAAIGLLWRKELFQTTIDSDNYVYADFYLVGFLIHSLSLLSMLLILGKLGFSLIRKTALYILFIYPFTTVLVSVIITTFMKKSRREQAIRMNKLQLTTLYEEAPIGIAITRFDGPIFYCNAEYERILGRSKDEVTSIHWEKLTHPDDVKTDSDLFRQFKSGQIKDYHMEKRFIRPDGSYVWTNMIVAGSTKSNDLTESTYMCIIEDISEAVKIKQELKLSLSAYQELYNKYKNQASLLRTLFNSISDCISYKDKDGIYLGCNKAFEKFTGVTEADLIRKSPEAVFNEKDSDTVKASDQAVLETKTQVTYEHTTQNADGQELILEVVKTPYLNDNNEVEGIVCVTRDITDRKRKEERITYISYHDALTGAYNRQYYEEKCDQFDKARDLLPLSVIMCDVNGLRLENDAFGHDRGDSLLKESYMILEECCRETDILCRIGGDEFCILLPNTDNQQASRINELIARKCEERSFMSKSNLNHISLACGFATKNSMSDPSIHHTIAIAEERMYRRKLLTQDSIYSTILTAIQRTLYEKSNETQEHGERMAVYSREIGQRLQLSKAEIDKLVLATTLHDLGKISIDLSILTKSDKLTESEWEKIRKHPEIGYRIARAIPELQHISEIILCHHERWDGLGYPRGLKQTEIPLLARIVAVVDAYDAMNEDRPYRKALSGKRAAEEISRAAGTQFDPEIAKLFVSEIIHG